jgi:molybdopterin converting factor small subunit
MATIQMPPVLRAAVGGEKTVQADGATLGALLDDLYERYPALHAQLKPGDDRLSRYVNIYVDDEDVRTLQGADTPVAAASTVTILPAMAGGNDQ